MIFDFDLKKLEKWITLKGEEYPWIPLPEQWEVVGHCVELKKLSVKVRSPAYFAVAEGTMYPFGTVKWIKGFRESSTEWQRLYKFHYELVKAYETSKLTVG